VSWERSLHGLGCSILGSPLACHGLDLSVKVDTLLTIKVGITKERTSGARERKHRQWYRNGYVHANLSNIDFLSKLSGSSTVCGKDGSSVTVWVVIDQFNGVVQGLDRQADKCWAKDLLFVASHVSLNIVDESWSNKVTVRVLLYIDVTTVQENLSTLLFALFNNIMNALLESLLMTGPISVPGS
jgi:hypothetical protein